MTKDRYGCPSNRQPDTSKVKLTVNAVQEFEIDTRKLAFWFAGSLLLCACVLSLLSSGLATPISYLGVAIGLFANTVPRRVLTTAVVDIEITWEHPSPSSSEANIELSFGSTE